MRRILTYFTKKRFADYEMVKEEAISAFEKDIEACNLVGSPIIDRFLIGSSVSNTLYRLKKESKSSIPQSAYDKMLNTIAEEIKRKFIG